MAAGRNFESGSLPAINGARWLLGAGLCVLALPSLLMADEFLLSQGGRVEGELRGKNAAEKQVELETASGIKLRLSATTISHQQKQTAAQHEYQQLAPLTADTAIAQWQLAQWCQQHLLMTEQKKHLRRVLELSPNHAGARSSLGYAWIDGQWTTKANHEQTDGHELYKGRWRTAQEIDLIESRHKHELAQKDWLVKLRRWRKELDGSAASTAVAAIASIKDPVAVGPIGEMLKGEKVRRVKLGYVQVLAQISTGESLQVLVATSLNDPDEEVFIACVDKIIGLKLPRRADLYIAALSDANNGRVNRAGLALARLEDKTAITPLIDSLITRHTRVLPGKQAGSPGSTTSTFRDDGGTNISRNEGPEVQLVSVRNQGVLTALNALSGGSSFGFDQRAWRYWHSQEKQAQAAREASRSILRE